MEWADLLALLLLILPLVGMKPVCGTNRMNEEYLSLNTGKSLRGLFAIAIVLHHLSQEATRTGGYLFRHFAYTGYLYVAFFFFLSGYGLQKSYIASENYKNGFLQKRLPKILLPYAIVALLYWIKNIINLRLVCFSFIYKKCFM